MIATGVDLLPGMAETAAGRDATVTVAYTKDPSDETLVMIRHWKFDDGEQATDSIRRRVLPAEEQESFGSAVGFCPAGLVGAVSEDLTVFVRKEKRVHGTGTANG